jgi:DNA repair protein RecO (recombination protein O)
MNWQDSGIIVSLRPFSENAKLVTIFTPEHGRHAGLVSVSKSSKNRQMLQPGHHVEVSWNARLAEHLGRWKVEVTSAPAARIMHRPAPLVALGACCHMIDRLLPERNPYPDLYEEFKALIQQLTEGEDWLSAYVRFELDLLEHTGFGLDLRCCAATGEQDNLAYISPKTGRAVGKVAGEPYKDRLLPLPSVLRGEMAHGPDDHWEALRVTGFFLNKHLDGGGPLRLRLLELVRP